MEIDNLRYKLRKYKSKYAQTGGTNEVYRLKIKEYEEKMRQVGGVGRIEISSDNKTVDIFQTNDETKNEENTGTFNYDALFGSEITVLRDTNINNSFKLSKNQIIKFKVENDNFLITDYNSNTTLYSTKTNQMTNKLIKFIMTIKNSFVKTELEKTVTTSMTTPVRMDTEVEVEAKSTNASTTLSIDSNAILAKIEQIRLKITDLKEKNTTLETTIRDLEINLTAAQATPSLETSQQIQGLTQKLAQATAEKQAIRIELDNIKPILENAERELQQIKRINESQLLDITSKQQLILNAETKISDLTAQHETCQQQSVGTASRLTVLQQKIEEQQKAHNAQLENINTQLDAVLQTGGKRPSSYIRLN